MTLCPVCNRPRPRSAYTSTPSGRLWGPCAECRKQRTPRPHDLVRVTGWQPAEEGSVVRTAGERVWVYVRGWGVCEVPARDCRVMEAEKGG
jgi:hypothetical protein